MKKKASYVPAQGIKVSIFVLFSFRGNFLLFSFCLNKYHLSRPTVKILKFGTPQTIAIIVLKIEKFDVTLH